MSCEDHSCGAIYKPWVSADPSLRGVGEVEVGVCDGFRGPDQRSVASIDLVEVSVWPIEGDFVGPVSPRLRRSGIERIAAPLVVCLHGAVAKYQHCLTHDRRRLDDER